MVAPIVYTVFFFGIYIYTHVQVVSVVLERCFDASPKKAGAAATLCVFGVQEEAMADKEPGWAPSNEAESMSVLTHPKNDGFFE